MLRRSSLRRVVFTEGYPFLEVFASRHFLEQHPLRHSNIWLDENDFSVAQRAAKARGVAMPLKIDAYAHHPRLSPYATHSSALTGRKRRQTAHVGPQAPTTGNTEPPYRVPICAATIYRQLHVFNADQMTLTDHRSLPISPSPGEGGELLTGTDQAEDGARALRGLLAAYPVVPSRHYNVDTKKRYYAAMEFALERLRVQKGFSQHWWGTRKQWGRLGATSLPGQWDHALPLPIQSKLVHISLIVDAEAILASSVIFTKSGVFHYCFPESDESGTHSLFHRLVADTRRHGYAVPLYTTSSQIAQFGWRLKANAVGVSAMDVESFKAPGDDADSIPDAVEWVAKNTVSPTVQSALPLHTDDDDVSAEGNHVADQGPAPLRSQTVFFYHVSQVHFPDPFFFPAAVVTAELEHPLGTPLHGLTGAPLPFDALRAESLAFTQPALSAILSVAPAGLTEVAPEAAAAVEAAQYGVRRGFLPTPQSVLAPPTALTDARVRDKAATSSRAEFEALLDEAAGADPTLRTVNATTPCAPLETPSSSPPPGASQREVIDCQTLANTASKKLKDFVAIDDATLARFVKVHSSPGAHNGRHLWFLAGDVLEQNGIVDVNATPVEVSVTKDDFVPGYRLTSRGLEPAAGAGLTGAVDGAGKPLPARHFFNVLTLEEPADVFSSINTTVRR